MRRVLLIVCVLLLPLQVESYEIATHEEMTRVSGGRAVADRVLKEDLGRVEGLRSTVQGRRLEEWLVQGGAREDNFPRFLNHFHNPLASTWSQAGLGGSIGQSSILWAQNRDQSAPAWSWQDVRQYLFEALTKPSSDERDKSLGGTLEGLGRQVHLVQDSASPAHSRNDPHFLHNYETVVDDLRIREGPLFDGWLEASSDAPDFPVAGWESLDGNPLAPIAIARLIDTDRYSGSNPAR